jgi:hypothetical protein
MPQNRMTSPSTPELTADRRWLTTLQIVDSPHFCKSPRLSRLLLYLAKQTLLERTDLLTEHSIAVEVFERNSDFHPSLDTIVRSHMVRLRQKLDRYAEEDSEAASIKVGIPKGEYVVRFERTTPTPSEPASFALPAVAMPSHLATPKRAKPFLIGCCLLAIILFVTFGGLLANPNRHTAAAPPVHPLWSHFFQPHQTTTFIAADSGLVLLHKLTAQDTTLAEYLSRDFSRETRGLPPARVNEVLDMANRRYTSFIDLNMFHNLERLPFASGTVLEVKYARDMHMDDLKQGNVILSGARGANPWLELYEPEMNFAGSNDAAHHSYNFVNRHPKPGERLEFSVTEADPKHTVLGVLAFLPNLDGKGNALIVEGNSMAGTEAISDFLFDDNALLPFLAQLKKSDGSLLHFEVLIESNSVDGSAGPFRILAYREHS